MSFSGYSQTADIGTTQVPYCSYSPNVAIITGGAQGMGYAISHRLADDGFDVAINDIPTKKAQIDAVVEEVRKKGRRAIAVPGDVSSEDDIISMVQKTVQELGGLDVMVANAGIPPAKLSILDTPLDNFEKLHAVNARGVFLCFKYAGRQMIKQGRGGRLIAASSVAGKTGGPTWTSYSASKFAVRAIAQCAAAELGESGITVNTYAPGAILTPMVTSAPDSQRPDLKITAGPDAIASIVAYLARPEAYFITGQSITVDGGHFRFD